MKTAIISNEFIPLNHTIIGYYGDINGGTMCPEISLNGVDSNNTREIISGINQEMNKYNEKIWIVEGYSNCVINTRLSTFNINPNTPFVNSMLDGSQESLSNIDDEELITVTTNAFSFVLPLKRFSFFPLIVDKFPATTPVDYFGEAGKVIERELNNFIMDEFNGSNGLELKPLKIVYSYSYDDFETFGLVGIKMGGDGSAESVIVSGKQCAIRSKYSHVVIDSASELSGTVVFDDYFITGNGYVIESNGERVTVSPQSFKEKTYKTLKVTVTNNNDHALALAEEVIAPNMKSGTYVDFFVGANICVKIEK